MKNTFGITIFSALIISMFLSCKKPTTEKLSGTWYMTTTYKDNRKKDILRWEPTKLKFTKSDYQFTDNSGIVVYKQGTYLIEQNKIVFTRDTDKYSYSAEAKTYRRKLILITQENGYKKYEEYKKE